MVAARLETSCEAANSTIQPTWPMSLTKSVVKCHEQTFIIGAEVDAGNVLRSPPRPR
jgi:hypothetical protein